MQGDIFIIGQIGSGQDETTGQFLRGVELVDVIAQFRALPESKKDVTVVIDSPGGYVETGDSIYNFLESKKKEGYKITTVQKGIVGSIATKIFMAGDKRVVNSTEEFFIHNPLVQNVTGDANVIQAVASQLQASKENLLNFYIEKTGNNKEALEPLMDAETSLSADQALALGFATSKTNEQKVFAIIKKENMNAKEVMDKINKGLADIKAMLQPASPAAPAPKAMELTLADGKMVSSDAASMDALVGSSTNAPDGEHKLADGSSIVVAGGKITELKPAAPVAPEAVSVAQFNELVSLVKDVAGQIKAVKDENTKAFDNALTELKSHIKGTHTPPKKRENQTAPVKGSKLSAKDILALKEEGKIEEYKAAYFEKYGVQVEG